MTTNPTVCSRRTRWGLLVTLAVAIAVAAGCSSGSGSPGVASLGGSSSPNDSPSGSSSADPIAYSQCMRAHGVPDFPDPDAQGRLDIHVGPGSDLNPNSPTFKAAQQACQSLQPTVSAQQQQQNYQALLKFSACMREHGIKDFPDPQPDGKMRISAGPGSDLSPNSPAFQAAQRACQKYMPGGMRAGAPAGSGGK